MPLKFEKETQQTKKKNAYWRGSDKSKFDLDMYAH